MITIRPLERQDVDALIALGEIGVHETRYHNQRYDPLKIRRQIDAYFRDERRKYIWLIALRNEELQGFLFGSIDEYWFTQDLCANMIVWYVSRQGRGSAMAVKLLIAFRRWAENRKATELTLSVTSGLNEEKTGRFLRRMGFLPCGENFHLALNSAVKAG